jgi:RNA polymerase sigma-70 factor, ECF subfamily
MSELRLHAACLPRAFGMEACAPVWPRDDSRDLDRQLDELAQRLDRACRGWFFSRPAESDVVPKAPVLAVDGVDWHDIQATLGGSSDAFARLINRYQQAIAAQMWRFSRQPSVFEDLVHDVFVEAYLSLDRFQGRSPFLHWLRKIAVRVGYRHWKSEDRRRRRTILPLNEAATVAVAEGDANAADTLRRVQGAIACLSPRDRVVITLIYLEEHSVATTASLLGWSETMVKVKALRARRKLKKLLNE